jgi:hypothetical protein
LQGLQHLGQVALETDLALFDPTDQLSDSPICEYDGVDTLCLFVISEPITGSWVLQVDSIELPLLVDYEATGIVLDGFTYQAILSSLAGEFV